MIILLGMHQAIEIVSLSFNTLMNTYPHYDICYMYMFREYQFVNGEIRMLKGKSGELHI